MCVCVIRDGGGGGGGLCSNFDVERHRETWSMTEGYHSNRS